MHKRQHGKSASARPQKKVRLADTATTHRFERNADSDRDDDDDGQLFETAVEQSLEKSKRQLAHRMRLDGYGSDDASSAGDSEEEMDGENLNARVSLQHHHAGSGSEDEEGHAGEKSGDEDDDLFAEKPAVAHDEDDDDLRPQRKGASSKKAKQLALNDIEGQEDDPDAAEQFTAVRNVADDDDGDDDGVVAGSDNDDDGARKPKVIKIEPFNMRTEMEEGGFDEEGAYIENKDVDRHHDNWLHGVSAKDIRKAAEAHERQKAASREKSERATFGGSKDDLMKELLTFLQPRENVIRALKRLGGNVTVKKRTWKKQAGGKKQQQQGTDSMNADGDSLTTEEDARSAEAKRAIERLTDIASALMGMGVSEVYEDVREEFRHDLQSRGILVDDAESQSAGSAALHTPAMAAASSATEAQWQYRWSPDGETFGPFPTAHMSAWFQQGFFTAPIWARQVRGNEALGSFEEVDPAKAAALFR